MRQIPNYEIKEFTTKKNKYALCIPVINEGKKIQNQLKKIQNLSIDKKIDIILCDGGSTDGSLEFNFIESIGVRTLLTKKDKGKLSAQLRMGYDYVLNQGYEGVVTVDGNDKDGMEAILDFITLLDKGYDFIQGSRYIKGGKAINTPPIRHVAVKLIHIPVISLKAGFKYTDTTNGFRGISRKLLNDERLNIFRDIFDTYELLAYMSVKAPKLGYKTVETPVIREYPKNAKTPTKISFFKGNSTLLKILWNILLDKYDSA
jgi:dolichol-phosphate mannosyltransferase